MKEILLELEDSLLFLEKINGDIALKDYKDKYTVDITEKLTKVAYTKNEKELEHILFNALSLYLIEQETVKEFKKGKDSNVKHLKEMLDITLNDLYYPVIINLEMERYFKSNNKLMEKAFVDFNLTGLKEELKEVYEMIKDNEENDKFMGKIQSQLLKSGIDIKDYDELHLSYNEEDIIILTNKKGEQVTPDNLYEKYYMQINADYDDDWLYDISFCTIVCLFFKTKKLYIPKDYEDIYNDLIENNTLQQRGLKLILCK